MNKLNKTTIYITIALYSALGLIASYLGLKTSIVVGSLVLVIEGVRILGILNKAAITYFLIAILNICLVGFNSYNLEHMTKNQQDLVNTKNQIITKYSDKYWVSGKDLNKMLDGVETINTTIVDWRIVTVIYFFLEVSLFSLIFQISRKKDSVEKVVTEKVIEEPKEVIQEPIRRTRSTYTLREHPKLRKDLKRAIAVVYEKAGREIDLEALWDMRKNSLYTQIENRMAVTNETVKKFREVLKSGEGLYLKNGNVTITAVKEV